MVGVIVEYRVSNHNSPYLGYWWGDKITLYAPGLWDDLNTKDEEHFTAALIHTLLTETICRGRAHSHSGLRVRGGKCKRCMPKYIADLMLYPDEWPMVREHYRKAWTTEGLL